MSKHNYEEFWQCAMDQIHQEYINNDNEDEFILWFSKIQYKEDTLDSITVTIPSEFLWQRIKDRGYLEKIKNIISELTGQYNLVINPQFNTSEININNSEKESSIKIQEKKEEPKINQKKENKTEKINKKINSTLESKFTFDTFIPGEGSSSKFAYNVALSVAENPGIKVNPLLLYGGVGLGKTHLMQAIGNKILEKSNDNLKICYIQAESFLNEFTSSLLNRNSEKFKSKYRNLDILLLDDIHFLQNKQGIQDELFYTFEALHKRNAQMVFTCDRPLKEIQNMAERLVTRLGSGMSLDLQPPNYETRKAIIQKKLELKGKNLAEEIIDYIALTIETNIRDLESALNKILGYAEFIDSNITIDIVQQQLSDIYSSPAVGNISIENIQKVVAENYQISVSDLKGKKRDKKYSFARFVAIYLTRNLLDLSFTEIGNNFGGRDHSSIMHGYEKIKDKISTDPTLMKKISLIEDEIKKYKG